MAYGIFRAHKLDKQNRKWLDNITNCSSSPQTPSYSYEKFSKNTDITIKISLTVETYSRTIFALDNKSSGIIQNKPVSNPYTKYMLISNILVDDYDHSFETPRINIHSGTAPSAYILLGDDDAHSFQIPRIKNHSVTEPSSHILLGGDDAQSFETPQNNHSVTAPSAHIRSCL